MASLEDQLREEHIAGLVTELAQRFPSFGSGSTSPAADSNPVALWLAEGPAKFALGVDIRKVVEAVFSIAARRAPNTSIAAWAGKP